MASLRLLLLPLALLLVAAPVRAQIHSAATERPHVLEIANGHVYLNGVVLPPESLPPDLDLTGITRTLEFSGPVTPYMEVDGEAYVLEDGRLVHFRDSRRAPDQVYVLFLGRPGADLGADGLDAMPEQQLVRMGEEAYLRQLSDRDRELYEQIRRDQALDRNALALAERARRTPPGVERNRLRAQLREHLAESFALKLAIHQEEIRRAQEELDSLREQLRQRESMKERIIEMRLRELLDE
ncbi:MAG: hypothetical protein ACK41D_12085 [Rubricoccaceae bacterium]